MTASILNRIDQRIAELGTSRRAVCIAAGLGPDYIRDLARKKNASPGLAAIEKLAPVLQTTVEWLRGEVHKTFDPVTPKPVPQILGSFDLPLFRSVEAGAGYIVVSTQPIDHIERPGKLERSPDAFAVVVSGESMSPEYEAGDMLFVDPYKPLVRDRNFIFIDDRHGDWKACVKRLLRWDAEFYHVMQHNPATGQAKEFTLVRAEWPKVYRVTGKYDRD